MLTTHGVAEGEWDGNEWVQYRWSCKVKDSDVLYWIHLEDLTQLEKEGDCFNQVQPEATSIKGYEQAEKDLALTWEDIVKIEDIVQTVFDHTDYALKGIQPAYEEVLRRFNELKSRGK